MISSGPLTTACKIETLYAKLANMNHQQKLRLAEAWVDIVYVLKVIYFHTSVKFRMFRPLLSSVYFHISSCICSYEHTLNLHRSLNFLTELFAGIMLPRSYLFGPIPSIQYFVSSKNLFLKWSMVWVLWIWVISLS